MFNLFRFCRKGEISFNTVAETNDIVAETGNIVANNGNNVKATFDFVEKIVQLVVFDNVAGVNGASTKLPAAWTMLIQHCYTRLYTMLSARCGQPKNYVP